MWLKSGTNITLGTASGAGNEYEVTINSDASAGSSGSSGTSGSDSTMVYPNAGDVAITENGTSWADPSTGTVITTADKLIYEDGGTWKYITHTNSIMGLTTASSINNNTYFPIARNPDAGYISSKMSISTLSGYMQNNLDFGASSLWTQETGYVDLTTTDNVRISSPKKIEFNDDNWYIGRNVYTSTFPETEIVTGDALQIKLYNNASQGLQILGGANPPYTVDPNVLVEVRGNLGSQGTEPLVRVHNSASGSLGVGAHHSTGAVPQVVNVCYGTGVTPPTTGAQSRVVEGTLYIQYSI